MKIYEITDEFFQINDLLEHAVDEDGEIRELTAEEEKIIKEWFAENSEHLESKLDNYGKFITNLKLQSEEAESTRKLYKSELDRLSARAKAFDNRRKALLCGVQYAMNLCGKEKIKTSLFSFGIQNSPISINTESAKTTNIPAEFLKVETTISKTAINNAIKNGDLIVTDSGTLFSTKTGEFLEGIKAERNKVLVMR